MSEHTPGSIQRWSSRPFAAALTRAAALLLPLFASVAFVYGAAALVPPPVSSLALYLGWWAALSLLATGVLIAAGRISRRLLPLAALLRLSLVFPDGAPSRFRTAMQSGTVKTLEDRLAEAKSPDGVTPAEVARRLLVLVAALDTHDSLTRGHSERVRAYAQMIGRELGLSPREIDLLNWAALVHDVGKLEVPHRILTKNGRPTEEEWAILERHPELGEALVAPLRGWLGDWCDAVGQHHERWDGTGYPRGLAGSEISLAGRIVAVADVFDVVTSARSYKTAAAATAGRAEIARCAGTQFDPDVVRAFLAISLRRGRAATGPLAWLAHAPVLARIPLTSAAGTLSAAAMAAAATTGVGLTAQRNTPPLSPSTASAPTAAAAIVTGDAAGGEGESAADSAAPRSARPAVPGSSPPGATPETPATPSGPPSAGTPTAPPDTSGTADPTPGPAADEPATDVPTVDVPAVDVPAVDVPGVDVPGVDVPAVDVPEVPDPEVPDLPPAPDPPLPAPPPTDPPAVPTIPPPLPSV